MNGRVIFLDTNGIMAGETIVIRYALLAKGQRRGKDDKKKREKNKACRITSILRIHGSPYYMPPLWHVLHIERSVLSGISL